MGEDKFSNLNANDVTSSSDGGAMMSSSASNGMTPSHGGNGMTSPSDADRIAASNDPTELSEYEHNVDIQERTGAGDIVPVGMSSSSPAITSGSNMPAGPTPGGAGAPPEHVLLSPDSAKGDDLLKPLANDPDGKLQALQDLRALTKAQKEEETSATEDSNKISDPAFLEEMSNRISVSGAPINSLGVAHTPTMPIRDIEQPESTLVIPGEKLKRDEKGSSHKTGFQEKNAQFTVDNKVVALGSGTEKEKFLTSPKAAQFQQLEGGASQLHLKTPEPEKSSQEAALGFSPHKPDITNNLAPRITELVKEIVRESLGSGRESKTKKGNGKAADEILDDPSKDAAVLLKSEKLETKPYDGRKNLGGSGRGPGASHRVSPQAHLQAENSKETVFLPNVPPNADGDHVLFGGEPQPTNNAGTMNILSKSNLSDKEKMKLINEYKASQKSSAEPSVQSKPESPTTSPEVDESKITEMLKSGKFNEQDLKSDFAGKEAAMQDMMMLEKEQALDDKLSQAHLQASQASKQNGPGNGLPPGSQQQGNTMSTPGNLSPDITLPGNVSPGASLPETLPAGMTQPGDGLSSDVALPENKLPAAGGQPQMPGFQNQMQGNKPSGERDDQFMMAKDTQMDRLLDQAQQGLPAGMGGENNAGMVKSTKAPQSKLINGFNDAVKSFDDSGFGHTTPNYDAVDPKGISKFVDTVQGLSPAEVKAYGIDVNNDVYIDKPARHRAAAQRSQPSGYTTMGAETGPDMESFNSIRKSKVGRKKSRQSRRL
ncbi:uncharacterized protein LOC114520355 [Dendronephthya gigantea]|uniref:uncharacterized protein LOC114520355 n=1 Tax=Dendronephthya gigantea TaxID=151771 RepID=UPI00106990D5|nr:uncharacterized protein LOC114520355 [Dendronephthya gigantea]